MSGQPTSARLRAVLARWEEYGPTNTARGELCTADGRYCAQGDILRVEGGMKAANPLTFSPDLWVMVSPDYRVTNPSSNPLKFKAEGKVVAGAGDAEVAELLGITFNEAAQIREINDETGRRPVEYLRLLAGEYEARERLAEAEGMVMGG